MSAFITGSPLILGEPPKDKETDEEIANVRSWKCGWAIATGHEVCEEMDVMRVFTHEALLEVHLQWPQIMGDAIVRLQTMTGVWFDLSSKPFAQKVGCTFNVAHIRAFRMDFPKTGLFNLFYSPAVNDKERDDPDFGTPDDNSNFQIGDGDVDQSNLDISQNEKTTYMSTGTE